MTQIRVATKRYDVMTTTTCSSRKSKPPRKPLNAVPNCFPVTRCTTSVWPTSVENEPEYLRQSAGMPGRCWGGRHHEEHLCRAVLHGRPRDPRRDLDLHLPLPDPVCKQSVSVGTQRSQRSGKRENMIYHGLLARHFKKLLRSPPNNFPFRIH